MVSTYVILAFSCPKELWRVNYFFFFWLQSVENVIVLLLLFLWNDLLFKTSRYMLNLNSNDLMLGLLPSHFCIILTSLPSFLKLNEPGTLSITTSICNPCDKSQDQPAVVVIIYMNNVHAQRYKHVLYAKFSAINHSCDVP